MGEFDLRVWIETWVEPCLRQLVKLEQFFESDENVIAIAAGKAKLFQRFGVDAVTDEMLTSQVGIVVNVGLGSADPMLALSKFEKAAQIAGGILGPSIQQSLNREAVIDEVFGKAGIKDASERFFQPGIDQDPQLQQAQKVVQELQGALQQAQGALSDKQAERDSKEKIATITAQSRQAPLDPNAQQKAQHDLIDAQKQADHDRAMQINEAANKASLAALQAQHAHEQQLSKDAMAQKDTAYKMEQLAIQKQEAYYKYLTAIDVAKINASGDLNQTELEAHIEGILGWQDHQPQMRANLLAAKVPAAQEQAPMQDGEPAPAAAAPVGKRKVQPHDMMMHGLAAMTGKIGEIGNQIIQTQKDIAAAPRDVIRNPDGTARGIQLKLS